MLIRPKCRDLQMIIQHSFSFTSSVTLAYLTGKGKLDIKNEGMAGSAGGHGGDGGRGFVGKVRNI